MQGALAKTIPWIPGWLFLLAGLGLVAAAILVPAEDRLLEATWRRDRAHAMVEHREERLERYRTYLAAIERADESVVRSLARSQLNLVSLDREQAEPLPEQRDISIFERIEPAPPTPPKRRRADSRLLRWSTDETGRLWLIACGSVAILVGLLPPTRPSARREDELEDPDFDEDEPDEEDDLKYAPVLDATDEDEEEEGDWEDEEDDSWEDDEEEESEDEEDEEEYEEDEDEEEDSEEEEDDEYEDEEEVEYEDEEVPAEDDEDDDEPNLFKR